MQRRRVYNLISQVVIIDNEDIISESTTYLAGLLIIS